MTFPIVRFAPSPTGSLHLGSVRTALFNWLYARSQNGKFILRIEDTDQARSSQDSTNTIIEGLKWLEIEWDEGPFFQSENTYYQKIADQLISENKAYYSKEDEKDRKAILFRMPNNIIKFEDLVYGHIEIDNALNDDLVIMKSDGMPTYHFACVVDDHFMKISHVIRGDDHLSNTPKQIAIYEALNWEKPCFVHLPMIHGDDGSKLSKRHGALAVMEYKRLGLLSNALNNYLSLLGWSPGKNIEIMDRKLLVENFSLKRINKKSAVFDYKKLEWINGEHIRLLGLEDFRRRVRDHLREYSSSLDFNEKALDLIYPRIKTFDQLMGEFAYFFKEDILYDKEEKENILNKKNILIIKELYEQYNNVIDFKEDMLENVLRIIVEKNEIKAKHLIHPLRFIVTGKDKTPGIFETMVAIGKDRCMKRIKEMIDAYELA